VTLFLATRNSQSVNQRPSSQRKLDDILRAAQEEFFSNGFSATSIEAIAARAQVSKVTIYNHFGDKAALFEKMFEKQLSQMRDNFEISNLDQKGLRDILTTAGLGMLDFLSKPRMVRVERMLAVEVNRDPKVGEFFLDAGPRSLLNQLARLLEASIERGEIQSDDVMHSAEMFPSLVMGRMDMMMRYGWEPDLSENAKKQRVERAVTAWMRLHQPDCEP